MTVRSHTYIIYTLIKNFNCLLHCNHHCYIATVRQRTYDTAYVQFIVRAMPPCHHKRSNSITGNCNLIGYGVEKRGLLHLEQKLGQNQLELSSSLLSIVVKREPQHARCFRCCGMPLSVILPLDRGPFILCRLLL